MEHQRCLRTILATLAIVLMFVAGCDGGTADDGGGGGGGGAGGGGTVRDTPRPTVDVLAALAALRNRASLVADGKVEPQPFVLDWKAIEGNGTLSKPREDAFCSALDLPKADDALASLAALALNALSEKFRHRPLVNEEAEGFLQLAATFAAKTCPTWKPQLVSLISGPSETPPPTPRPGTFRTLLADPNVTWAWSKPESIKCVHKSCWQIDVQSRLGCSGLHVVLAIRDSDRVVLRKITFDSPTPVGLLTPAPVLFWIDANDGIRDGIIDSISCT